MALKQRVELKRARTDCKDVRTITKGQNNFARSVYSVLQYADFVRRYSLLSKCRMVPQFKYNFIYSHKNGPRCADVRENRISELKDDMYFFHRM